MYIVGLIRPWWRHYLIAGLLLGLGLSLTRVVTLMIVAKDERLAQESFQRAANDRIQLIVKELIQIQSYADQVRRFYVSSQRVEEEEFRSFVSGDRDFSRDSSIQAVMWVDRIAAAERSHYEAFQARGLPGFVITEDAGSNPPAPAAVRDEYYPVSIMEPRDRFPDMVGFDVTTRCIGPDDINRLASHRSSIICTKATAQDRASGVRLLRVLSPVFKPADAARPSGFAMVVVDLHQMIVNALASMSPSGIDLRLEDLGAAPDERLLYEHLPGTHGPAEASPAVIGRRDGELPILQRSIPVGDRQWVVTATAVSGHFESLLPHAWGVLFGGILITLLLVAYVFGIQRRNLRITSLAEQKIQALEAMRSSDAKLTAIATAALDAIVMLDAQGTLVYWNQAAERILGYRAQEAVGQDIQSTFVPERFRAAYLSPISAAMQDEPGRPGNTLELFARHKSGVEIPIELSVSSAISGQSWYVIGILRDISERKATERALIRATEKAVRFFNNTAAIMVALDPDGRISDINDSGCRILGYPHEVILGHDWIRQFVPKNSQATARNLFNLILERKFAGRRQVVGKAQCADGSTRLITWQNSLLESADGKAEGILCAGFDITKQHRMEAALRASEAHFHNVVHKNRSGIIVVSSHGQILFANPAAEGLLFRTGEQLVGEEYGVPAVGTYTEMNILRRDGDRGIAEMSATETEWQGETAYLVMLHDITERKEAEQRVEHMAYHDALTGLPNRSLFKDRVEKALQRAHREGTKTALLYMDVNRFKAINDTMGHSAGDELLKVVASRLSASVRESDTVARMSGDEFTILLEGLHNQDEASMIASKIQRSFDMPALVSDKELYISLSIGISVSPDDCRDGESLIKQADIAMYHAKRDAARNISYYSAEMTARTAGKLELENNLRRALERNEFELHYQPQIQVTGGQIIGFEALLRWSMPGKGNIPPNHFIPVLEETGQIVDVGAWVIRSVCIQMKDWLRQGIAPVPVAVNVSARQLVDLSLLDTVQEALKETGLPNEYLGIEVTESAVMEDTDRAIEVLKGLSEMGIWLHMDDFGTGYSSLSMLRRLPFDSVKIDRSFIANISTDTNEGMLTEAIIAMAHSLNKQVIAEGVETDFQLQFLRQQNCDQAQGFLLGRPMPAAQAVKLLTERPVAFQSA